jgi:hypothetical protein
MEAIRDWINRIQWEQWQSTSRQKHANGFLQKASTERIRKLLVKKEPAESSDRTVSRTLSPEG